MDNKNIMLTSPNSVKAVSYINNNVTDDVIGASIREAGDIHLQSIIGTALYRRLQELVNNKIQGVNDNIDSEENEAYKFLLDEYVEPYLISKVQFLICQPISYKVRNMGVIQNSDANVNKSTSDEIGKLANRFNTEAMRRATALSMYLCKNKSAYPELTSSCDCNDVKPMLGRRFVNVPINLGGSHGDCCC